MRPNLFTVLVKLSTCQVVNNKNATGMVENKKPQKSFKSDGFKGGQGTAIEKAERVFQLISREAPQRDDR